MNKNTTVDMSPRAIDLRLRQLAGLYRLELSLRQAQLIDPVETQDRDEIELLRPGGESSSGGN